MFIYPGLMFVAKFNVNLRFRDALPFKYKFDYVRRDLTLPFLRGLSADAMPALK